MERTIAAIVGALIIAGAAIGLWKVSIYALQIVATPIVAKHSEGRCS